MRLDKYIAQVSELSRSQVKKALKAERVTVNGELVKDPSQHIDVDAEVLLDQEPLSAPGPRYFMLNKPQGYVCATHDGEHPTALDLLDEINKDSLQIAGRLDIDTTGLVLITDDGQWNHIITSPRHECPKTYYACLAHDLAKDAEEKLAQGLMLDSETKPTRPASLERLYTNEVKLTISEGKYHQVKRMFAALGNRVTELHRERIGGIELDSTLEPGDYRPLTDDEIASINTPNKNT